MSDTSDTKDNGLMHSLVGVRRLENDKFDLYQNSPRKKFTAKIRTEDSYQTQGFQQISHNIPEEILNSWFHHGIQKKLQRKIKTGQLTIDTVLDLHGHRQHEAIKELESFMRYAHSNHARFVLIIHGKGFNSQSEAVLRPLVQHWLSEQNMVLAYCPAQDKDGGSGASYVYLKNSKYNE